MQHSSISDKVQIVTTISKGIRSNIYLGLDSNQNFLVVKVLNGEDKASIYSKVQALKTTYLPEIYEVAHYDGCTYVYEEYVEGYSLSVILDKEISFDDGIRYIRELINAVSVLHQMKPALIHRDIKPDNILVLKNGNIKLLDFDAAREYIEGEKERDTSLLGTRGYASPEQFGFSQTDERSDIYSIGIVGTEIAGKMRMTSRMQKKIKGFLDKATMFDPDRRYQSTSEMLSALEKAIYSAKETAVKFGGAVLLILSVFAAGFCLWKYNSSHLLSQRESTAEYERDSGALVSDVPSDKKESQETKTLVPVDCTKNGWSILPEQYVYRSGYEEIESRKPYLLMRFPGIDELPDASDGTNDGQNWKECVLGEDKPLFCYNKAYPQSLILKDYHFDDRSVEDIRLSRFSDNGRKYMESIRILQENQCEIQNGILCLDIAVLNDLAEGIYDLQVFLNDDSEWGCHIQITEEREKIGQYPAHLMSDVQYYLPDKEADLFFYVWNTPYGIKDFFCNNREMREEDYDLTADGRGIIIKMEYLEQHIQEDCLDIEMVLEDQRHVYGRILVLK